MSCRASTRRAARYSVSRHPPAEELEHDFLWRTTKRMPERGRIGIFNRSYYEEVLITRVHPEFILKQNIPGIYSIDDIDGSSGKNDIPISTILKAADRQRHHHTEIFPSSFKTGAESKVPVTHNKQQEKLEIHYQ
jgi:hypothetical protein